MLEETLHQRLLAHIESTEHTAMTKTASILYELGLLIALVSRLAANDSMIEGDLYRLLDLYTQ